MPKNLIKTLGFLLLIISVIIWITISIKALKGYYNLKEEMIMKNSTCNVEEVPLQHQTQR